MKKYVALLRGINVSGQKKILMADLRELLSKIGLQNVQTYIQSGNVIFESTNKDKELLEEQIHEAILKKYGFDVPVLVTTKKVLVTVLEQSPFTKEEDKKKGFTLFQTKPNADLVKNFNMLKFKNEDFYISNLCIYLVCHQGFGRAKLNLNLIERKLKVRATSRNLKTMQKLIEMANQ